MCSWKTWSPFCLLAGGALLLAAACAPPARPLGQPADAGENVGRVALAEEAVPDPPAAPRGAAAAQPDAAGARRIEYALALHGGVGKPQEGLTAEQRQKYVDSMSAALQKGRDLLAGGGSSLDAVELVVRHLEDDGKFNAGRGSVFNIDGGHELHASIMDGRTRRCGAVAAVDTVKNPVSLARLVMTDTPFILLISDGAETFAREKGVALVEPGYYDTELRRENWRRAREKLGLPVDKLGAVGDGEDWYGTVGCVALDRDGNLAAATSTGGVAHKRFGRMGDSSIIGAGNFADNQTCAVSCTGIGEHFIRNVVAYDVSVLVEYKGWTLAEAARHVVQEKLPDEAGGLIALGPDGTIVMESNRDGMRRAAADSTGRFEVHFWE